MELTLRLVSSKVRTIGVSPLCRVPVSKLTMIAARYTVPNYPSTFHKGCSQPWSTCCLVAPYVSLFDSTSLLLLEGTQSLILEFFSPFSRP